MITKDQVIEVAKSCFDPEIPVNIWDLGLIYDIEIAEHNAIRIKMSLTSKHCPAAQEIPENLKTRLMDALSVSDVNIQLVFDPPWTPERISHEGKKIMGLVEE